MLPLLFNIKVVSERFSWHLVVSLCSLENVVSPFVEVRLDHVLPFDKCFLFALDDSFLPLVVFSNFGVFVKGDFEV